LTLWPLRSRKIPFLTKQELEVYYKGHKLTTRYKPDLLVFGGIVVELKAVYGTVAGA
jgi:GxxExxY protein